mmetsp:Transcript_13204/g.33844  ORF Transcript_13204/g.33844 Transcript_13204/m.33844 type:complete len:260 (+) Transcript_13204:265-1044(+)
MDLANMADAMRATPATLTHSQASLAMARATSALAAATSSHRTATRRSKSEPRMSPKRLSNSLTTSARGTIGSNTRGFAGVSIQSTRRQGRVSTCGIALPLRAGVALKMRRLTALGRPTFSKWSTSPAATTSFAVPWKSTMRSTTAYSQNALSLNRGHSEIHRTPAGSMLSTPRSLERRPCYLVAKLRACLLRFSTRPLINLSYPRPKEAALRFPLQKTHELSPKRLAMRQGTEVDRGTLSGSQGTAPHVWPLSKQQSLP